MTNTLIDLWPDDLVNTEVVPPIAILKQQATALGNKTRNLIEGQVTTQTDVPRVNGVSLAGRIRHVFNLVAPAMGGYTYPLLTVDHYVDLYPVTVTAFDHSLECDTEEEFTEALRSIFAEQNTKRILSALIAQSTA